MSQYVGRRIVPTHGGVWDGSRGYEELTIVLNEASGESYISRRSVPAGTAIGDKNYWMQYSLWSEQVTVAEQHLDAATEDVKTRIETSETKVAGQLQQTERTVSDKLAATEDAVEKRTAAAEQLTNENKAAIESRMDAIEKRQDANVSASTDKNADYAAEVVDARIDCFGAVHDSLGDSIRGQFLELEEVMGVERVKYETADRSDMTKTAFSGSHNNVMNNDVYEKDLYVTSLHLISKTDVSDQEVGIYTVDQDNKVTIDYGKVKFTGAADEVLTVSFVTPLFLAAGDRIMLYHKPGFGTGNGILLCYQSVDVALSPKTGFKSGGKGTGYTVGDAVALQSFGENAAIWIDAEIVQMPYADKEAQQELQQEVEDARTDSMGKTYQCLGEVIRALSDGLYVDTAKEIDTDGFSEGKSASEANNMYGNSTVYPQCIIRSVTLSLLAETPGEQKLCVMVASEEKKQVTSIAQVSYTTDNTESKEIHTFEGLNLACNEGDILLCGGSVTGTRIGYNGGGSENGCNIRGSFYSVDKIGTIKAGDSFVVNQTISKARMSISSQVVYFRPLVDAYTDTLGTIADMEESESGMSNRITELESQLDVLGEAYSEVKEEMQNWTADNLLSGKKIVAIGDSMTYGHNVTGEKCWLGKIALRNGMTYVNYGRNGCFMSYNVEGGSYPPEISVVARYESMDDDADYILVFAGTNDAGRGIELGTVDSTDNTTYMGALNEICAGLQTKYPTGKIGFITPYHRNQKTEDYITAIETICAKYSIPVFNNWKYGGINFSNTAQAAALTLGDNTHLNEAGMEYASHKYEAFLRSL